VGVPIYVVTINYIRRLCPLSKVFVLGGSGASFSCPGWVLMCDQYCELVMGFLQTGQFAWPHLWCPTKLGWIVTLHWLHLFVSKIFSKYSTTQYY